jgi:hypothetical protein
MISGKLKLLSLVTLSFLGCGMPPGAAQEEDTKTTAANALGDSNWYDPALDLNRDFALLPFVSGKAGTSNFFGAPSFTRYKRDFDPANYYGSPGLPVKKDGVPVASFAVPPEFNIIAMCDFNGDNENDIIFRHLYTNQIAIWYIRNGALSFGAFVNSPGTTQPITLPSSSWRVQACGKFDNSGRASLLFEQQAGGALAIWRFRPEDGQLDLTATRMFQINGQNAALPPGWKVTDVGDVDGNGVDDLVWMNVSTFDAAVWWMNTDGNLLTASFGPEKVNSAVGTDNPNSACPGARAQPHLMRDYAGQTNQFKKIFLPFQTVNGQACASQFFPVWQIDGYKVCPRIIANGSTCP